MLHVRCCCVDFMVTNYNFMKYPQHLLSLLSLLICGEAALAQKPRLSSKIPLNPLEPIGDWVWGKLINGFVYRARSSYGGDGGGKSNVLERKVTMIASKRIQPSVILPTPTQTRPVDQINATT